MALYYNLPVYKAGYDLLMEIYRRTEGFPRSHRYTLGERMKNETTAFLISIYSANSNTLANRLEPLDQARSHLEVVRLLVRLSRDLKITSLKGFVAMNLKIEEVSKQISSWRRYTAGAHVGK